MIHVTELKTGTRVRLCTGWYMTLQDGQPHPLMRNTSMGPIYTKWIDQANVGGEWTAVDHTRKEPT